MRLPPFYGPLVVVSSTRHLFLWSRVWRNNPKRLNEITVPSEWAHLIMHNLLNMLVFPTISGLSCNCISNFRSNHLNKNDKILKSGKNVRDYVGFLPSMSKFFRTGYFFERKYSLNRLFSQSGNNIIYASLAFVNVT